MLEIPGVVPQAAQGSSSSLQLGFHLTARPLELLPHPDRRGVLVPVEDGHRVCKRLEEIVPLRGNVEPVDPIEDREDVLALEDQRLPRFVVLPILEGRDRLDEDHRGPDLVELERSQHVRLGSFDVDLEKVDGAPAPVLADQRVETRAADARGGKREALRYEAVGRTFEPRQTGVGRGDPEVGFSFAAGNGPLDVDVSRPPGDELGVLRARLDVDAVPTGIVEQLGDRMDNRVAGTDVDVEPVPLRAEDPPEPHILRVLGVRDDAGLVPASAELVRGDAARRTAHTSPLARLRSCTGE